MSKPLDRRDSTLCLQQGAEVGFWHRALEKIALMVLATQFQQKITLGSRFYPLGNQLDAKLLCHADNRPSNCNIVRVIRGAPYKLLINLEKINGKALQLGQV